jgi:hypothetical protein
VKFEYDIFNRRGAESAEKKFRYFSFSSLYQCK